MRILPRDEKFYDMFTELAIRLTASATLLHEMFVSPSELPDYRPAFMQNSVRADLDGNVWIRTTATRPATTPPDQSSLPSQSPPATTGQTTGEASRDPVIKKMNEDEKAKVDTKGSASSRAANG